MSGAGMSTEHLLPTQMSGPKGHISKDPKDYIEILRDVLEEYDLPEPRMRLGHRGMNFEVKAIWPCGYVIYTRARTAPAAAERVLELLVERAEAGIPLPGKIS